VETTLAASPNGRESARRLPAADHPVEGDEALCNGRHPRRSHQAAIPAPVL